MRRWPSLTADATRLSSSSGSVFSTPTVSGEALGDDDAAAFGHRLLEPGVQDRSSGVV